MQWGGVVDVWVVVLLLVVVGFVQCVFDDWLCLVGWQVVGQGVCVDCLFDVGEGVQVFVGWFGGECVVKVLQCLCVVVVEQVQVFDQQQVFDMFGLGGGYY